MGYFLALIKTFLNSLFFWDKEQLKAMDDYIRNNDIEQYYNDYGNEYIKEIIELKYYKKMKQKDIPLIVPYSEQAISFIIKDFKKYLLTRIK